jgi:DNA-binding MarR family transcriptional regulator
MKAYPLETSQDRRPDYYRTQIREHSQKYAHSHWPSEEIFLNFVYTYHRIGDVMDILFNEFGLSRACVNALRILSRSQPQGCIQQDLSMLLLVSRANITGLVNGLMRQGLVTRTVHPKDKRAYIVKITKKGEKLLGDLIPRYHQTVNGIMEFLDPADKKTLKQILKQMQKGILKAKGKT